MYGWRARIGHVAPSRGTLWSMSSIRCPRWPTITKVQLLEGEIGKPVVTSSLACSWYAMKLIDIEERVVGSGSLMASLGV